MNRPGIDDVPLIAAAAVSFSANAQLVGRLKSFFPNARINQGAEKLEGQRLVDFLNGAQGIIVSTEKIDESVLNRLPSLKVVSKYGVGLDSIDSFALQKMGIHLGWTGGVNRRSVAELTLGFMLGLSRNIFKCGEKLRAGIWQKNGGSQLSDKTIGVLGCGNIGTDLIGLLSNFGCRILIHDLVDKTDVCQRYGAVQVPLSDLQSQSDIISLHLPLDNSTHHLVNLGFLKSMRSSAFIINTARGAIVDQNALKIALREGLIAGAALDVFEEEPVTDIEMLSLENFWGTAHIGGNAKEAVLAMGNSAIDHLLDFFEIERR